MAVCDGLPDVVELRADGEWPVEWDLDHVFFAFRCHYSRTNTVNSYSG